MDLIIKRATALALGESAGTAAAFLQKDTHLKLCFKIFLTEYNECTFVN